jgi:rhodanese-related sulfurtransferase|tara:strand:+ start:1052 stop:1453 length:402 start_codon:yes stop_codon:yes gene_type:complete
MNKIKSSIDLVNEANKEIKTLKASEIKRLLNNDEVNLVDIRDIRELWKEGTIKNAMHIPRGMLEFWLDPESTYFKEKKIGKIKNLVLFCALGMRSALATKSLLYMGFKNVAHVEGGFDALKNAGLEVVIKEKK